MQFHPAHCPTCHGLPKGTVESLEGLALLEPTRGGFRYTGTTESLSDTQRTRRTRTGRVELECEEAHRWFATQTRT